MTGLETTFYIVGIVFMGLMLLLTLVVGIAVLVIRNKVIAIHRQIEERLASVNEWVEKGEAVVGAIKKVSHKAKKQ